MKPLLTFIFLLIIYISALSQTKSENKISVKDSLELQSFWITFKASIDDKDKIKLSNLFNFPFYCIQCADYVSPNDTTGETVLVTRKIFDTAIYKLFFRIPNQNPQNKQMWTEDFVFMAAHYDKTIFMFSYVAIPPSKSFEGSQGFIYVKKIKGKFKIISLDTVP